MSVQSYRFSQEHNAQSLLWDSCGLIVATVRQTAAIVGRCLAIVSHFLPILLTALGLVAVIAAAVAVAAMVPPTFWICLVGLAIGAYVTYPRSKAVRK